MHWLKCISQSLWECIDSVVECLIGDRRVVGWSLTGAGFIRVREMSVKSKFFQGQGIVREFYVGSVKNGYLLKCQGNVREFYNFHNLYQTMRNRKLLGQFSHILDTS